MYMYMYVIHVCMWCRIHLIDSYPSTARELREAQVFELKSSGHGYLILRHKKSGLCMSLEQLRLAEPPVNLLTGKEEKNLMQLVLRPCDAVEQLAQQWQIVTYRVY